MAEVTTEPADTVAGRGELASLARSGLLNLVGAVVSGIANLALVVAITHGFSRADAGVFFSATSVFLIVATLARLGTPTGLVYFISRHRALEATERIRATLRHGLVPVAVAGLIGGGLLAVLASPLATAVSDDTAGGTRDLRILAIFLPFAAVFGALLAGTQGFRQMRATVLLDKIGRPLLQLGLVIAAALLGGVTLLLPLAWALPYAPAAVLAALWLAALVRRRTSANASRTRVATPHEAREFWRFTAPRALAGGIQIVLQRMDIVLVGILRGPVDAAIYTAATRFLVVGQLAAQSINTAAQPRLGESLARGDLIATGRFYRTATAWLIIMTWPLYLLAGVFSGVVMSVFGHGYSAGTTVMIVLAATMLLATACGMVDMVLTMAGRTTWNLANYGVALGVNLALNLILIPPLGIAGAAIAWAAAICAKNLLPLAQIAVSLRLHPFSRGSVTACLLAAVCFAAIPIGVRVAFGDGLGPALLALAVGGAVYAAGLWRFRAILRLDAMPLLGSLARRRSRTADRA